MTRILFTVINDLNYDQRMIRICSSLQKAGYECVLIGRKLPDSNPIIARDYGQKRIQCVFNKGKKFYLEYNIRLFFYLLFYPCQAICSVDLDTVLPGLFVTRIRGKKRIFDAHEIFTQVPEVINRPRVQKFWEWVQKRAFTNGGLHYTIGSELAAYFVKLYGCKVEVIRNMPPIQASVNYNPNSEKFILYQGALNAGRGLEALILAMKDLDCKLVLAGEGDLSMDLRELVKVLKLEGKIEFLGFILPSDLPELTSKAWIGMNVSENMGMSYYLSLNNKFFDYVHAGLPSLINPFPEYVALNSVLQVGVITEPVVSDIVRNAKLLLENSELHKTLHNNCVEASKNLNWDNEEKRLLKIYNTYFGKN